MTTVKPDLYYEKSLRHVMQQAFDRGNPCCTLPQPLIARVEPGSTFAIACIATCDETCIATWETQIASWALAHHSCFPLVALDLRQDVTTTCRVSHVACRSDFFIV